jgi:bifunctional non-homologous end joining protein LigD
MNLLHSAIRPMLAGTSEAFDSKNHFFELKWDGMRCIVFLEKKELRLQNRNLRIVTQSYPELQVLTEAVKHKSAILDGEIVVLEDGIPSFGKLQNRFQVDEPLRLEIVRKLYPVTYVAFDLLYHDGHNLTETTLEKRKERLREIIEENPNLLYGDHVEEQGKLFFNEAVKKGFEGVIAKQRDSPYLIGQRSQYWLKIKGKQTIDAIVAGYTEGEGRRADTFGALVLAAYNSSGKLIHLGNVGTGFTDAEAKYLLSRLKPMKVKGETIHGEVKAPTPITWVRPQLVCEVEYDSMTLDQKLRLPRYKHLRTDVSPEECVVGT